jgi:uncharacterized protein (DUF849 family)
MDDLCIMVAPNGARRGRADHPALPILPEELAETARACQAEGAAAIHLHVRDAAGVHTLEAEAYRPAIDAVRAACPDMVIQTTTEAAGLFTLDQQLSAARALCPPFLSFGLAELMREGEARGRDFLAFAAEHGIGVQFILYEPAHIRDFARLYRAGALHLAGRPRLILVAGRYSATLDSDLGEFEALHAALQAEGLDEQAIWMTCAFGRGEMACLERTIELGGHARVGFENAIVDAQGRPARDNAERVALVAELARRHGRALAGPEGAARVLGRD